MKVVSLPPSRARHSTISVAVSIGALLGLAACNGSSGQLQGAAEDWIEAPASVGGQHTDPAPLPTATSAPANLYSGPAEMAPYVNKFVADALIQGLDVLPKMKSPKLEIRIASLDSYGASTIGLCETSGSMRRVTFDPDFWDVVDETQRELVAHHELGHCVLYRSHRSTYSGAIYASIMYPAIMSNSNYEDNYGYYQNELFTYGVSALQQAGVDGGEASADEPVTHVCDGN